MALIQLRDKAAQQLKQAMQALFDNADDTLFEMADRASSNSEQNAFFEAMRDLRLKRKTIERGFLQRVFESFATLNQYEIGAAPVLGTVSTDALSLGSQRHPRGKRWRWIPWFPASCIVTALPSATSRPASMR